MMPWLARFRLGPNDLLRDRIYRRLWTSILISSFGGQITMLALPLTAAVLLQATPTQMGLLTAMELAPFVLFSLPSGVWLDRVRKLPVYIAGEAIVALILASVPLVWALDGLSMHYLYGVAFCIGCIFVTAGTAAQIVLTQVVPRERLVEAHAKNALASSGAEVAGPGVAGVLIKLVGAPLALLADAVLLFISVLILRGVKVTEVRVPHRKPHFWHDLREGLSFVVQHRLLLSLALVVGLWQMCHHAAMVVQILYATRTLGLNEHEVGLCYIGLGLGTVVASTLGHRISRRLGPGPCLVLGFAVWLWLAAARLVTRRGLGHRVLRPDAAVLQRRCRADLHQLFGAAPGRNARTPVGPHDQHHALADPDSRRPRRPAGRLRGRTCRLALCPGVGWWWSPAAGGLGLAASGDTPRAEFAEAQRLSPAADQFAGGVFFFMNLSKRL